MTTWLIGLGCAAAVVGGPLGLRRLLRWRHELGQRGRHAGGGEDASPLLDPGAHWLYGSMNLEDERAWRGQIQLPRLGGHLRVWGSGHTCDSDSLHEGDCVCECGIPAPYVGKGEPGWREQTMADLSPEALGADVYAPCRLTQEELLVRLFDADPSIAPEGWRGPDSGPGDPSQVSPPGPDQGSCFAAGVVDPGSNPARLRGPEQPHEKPAGTESAGSGHYFRPVAYDPERGFYDQDAHRWENERLADAGDIRAARGDPWLDGELEKLYAWVREMWGQMA